MGGDVDLNPLFKHFGATVSGLDLLRPPSEDVAHALRAALKTHRLLHFRQPGLSQDDQVRFTRIFGELYVSRAYKGEMGEQGYYFSNTRPDGQLPIGELQYHHDHLFNPEPCRAAVLYAIEVPESGGATTFRDSIEILARLPAELRERARGIGCVHVLDYAAVTESGRVDLDRLSPKARRARQPLVWTDPESGREALWVVPLTTVDFDGIERDAGHELLDALWNAAAAMSDLEYVHHWQVGDLLIWDNRLLGHARLPFDPTQARTLRRTTVR